jgi:transposase
MLIAGDSPRLDGENLGHVQALAQDGISWPPILVQRSTMRVIDGMHRLLAARMRGDPAVEVRFFDGDEAEAFVAAVKANVTHGLPLTLADREAATARIITLMPERSDRWISEVTGMAPGTVAAIRRRSGLADGPGAARIGRDGRVRPVNVTEGRLRAQEVLVHHPDASLREIAQAAGISVATAKSVRDRVRRGNDPLPPAQRHTQPSLAGHRQERDKHPTPHRSDNGALARSLQRLTRDPSLRYTESGRVLLRWLDVHARGPDELDTVIAKLPQHCKYMLADVARRCAREWQDFASALDHDLRAG